MLNALWRSRKQGIVHCEKREAKWLQTGSKIISLYSCRQNLSNQDLKVFNLWLTKAHAYLIEKDEINGGKSWEKPQKLEPMEE